MTAELLASLDRLIESGWAPEQVAMLSEAIAEARSGASGPEHLFDLVLSGPDVPGIPTRDTAPVMHTLIEEAKQEVLLVGYAVHNGKKLFERLARRMVENPELSVWFCLNVHRGFGDTSLSSEIVRRFALEFRTKHWPWEPRPALYYDPRSVDDTGRTRSSLHAKCLIVDRREALVTSANFTEAAQQRNIEAGLIVRYPPFVERLLSYFEGLRNSGTLRRCHLD